MTKKILNEIFQTITKPVSEAANMMVAKATWTDSNGNVHICRVFEDGRVTLADQNRNSLSLGNVMFMHHRLGTQQAGQVLQQAIRNVSDSKELREVLIKVTQIKGWKADEVQFPN